MSDENTTEATRLSHKQEEAIRRYIIRLVAIPGGLVTIISGLTGYVAGQYENAQVIEKALPIITTAATDTGRASGQASNALEQAGELLKVVRQKAEYIDTVKDKIDDILATKNNDIKKNLSEFSAQLALDPNFRNEITKATQSDLFNLKSSLQNLDQRFSFSINRSGFTQQSATVSCPPATHLISASCLGNNGNLQAAVGPQVQGDNTASCYRYGPEPMPVQATAVCLGIR